MADQFVSMQKGDEQIRVHSDVVKAHEQIGWKVVEETPKVPVADLTPQPPSPQGRESKAAAPARAPTGGPKQKAG